MKIKRLFACVLAVMLLTSAAACSKTENYVLSEQTFFLVMTNMQYYPEQYLDSEIEYDCFTYRLTDVNGTEYMCGVRKCSAGYGCTCGNDTVIGFVLRFDGEIPEPRNQSEDTNDKTWIHVKGKITGTEKQDIVIYAVNADGTTDYDTTETISFLTFDVKSLELIEDCSGLNYYVTK